MTHAESSRFVSLSPWGRRLDQLFCLLSCPFTEPDTLKGVTVRFEWPRPTGKRRTTGRLHKILILRPCLSLEPRILNGVTGHVSKPNLRRHLPRDRIMRLLNLLYLRSCRSMGAQTLKGVTVRFERPLLFEMFSEWGGDEEV